MERREEMPSVQEHDRRSLRPLMREGRAERRRGAFGGG